jgi:hypothetical protein
LCPKQIIMKKLVAILTLILFSAGLRSQTDTLYFKNQTKLPCRIIEINEYDIKYNPKSTLDGPTVVISRNKVYKYVLSNGVSEILQADELSIETEHADILNNRTVIKIHPFSIMGNDLAFAYERVIRVGMNLDAEFGYINSNLNDHPFNGNYPSFYSGFYVKPGLKFFLGQDYSVKGMKYAHPLKGRYIKLDLAYGYIRYDNLTDYNYTNGNFIKSDYSTNAYGMFVNYGRQFILGNILTMEYYIGVGYTGYSGSYSNREYENLVNQYGSNYWGESLASNFHGFIRSPGVGLSLTAGFRLGYILPSAKPAAKKPQAH